MHCRPTPLEIIGRGPPAIPRQIILKIDTTTQLPNRIAVTTITKKNVTKGIMRAPFPV